MCRIRQPSSARSPRKRESGRLNRSSSPPMESPERKRASCVRKAPATCCGPLDTPALYVKSALHCTTKLWHDEENGLPVLRFRERCRTFHTGKQSTAFLTRRTFTKPIANLSRSIARKQHSRPTSKLRRSSLSGSADASKPGRSISG